MWRFKAPQVLVGHFCGSWCCFFFGVRDGPVGVVYPPATNWAIWAALLSVDIHRSFVRGTGLQGRWRGVGFGLVYEGQEFVLGVWGTFLSESGLTAVANEAAPHQTDADAAAARASSSSDLIMVETDTNEIVEGSNSLIGFDHGYDDDDDDGISVDETGMQKHTTACGKGSTTAPTTATGE